jgi:hypothetical protein
MFQTERLPQMRRQLQLVHVLFMHLLQLTGARNDGKFETTKDNTTKSYQITFDSLATLFM